MSAKSFSLLLNSFRERRVPFPTMRTMLANCELPSSNGWTNTIHKIIEEVEKDSNKYSRNFDSLKELYSEHLLVGEKAIRFFKVERLIIKKLIDSLQSYEIEQSGFSKLYPFPLPKEELENPRRNDLKLSLVDILESEENLSLVFCSKRLLTERIQISTLDFSAETKRDLSEYDEILGVKTSYRQFFDAVVIWKKKDLIEIRIDIFTEGLSHQERQNSFLSLSEQFNKLALKLIGVKYILNENINFFPLIDRLYESDEGKVSELYFTTDEGSIKREKMRKDMIDLREETYHKSGRNSVDHINAYHLAILWDFISVDEVKTQPELLLPAQFYTLNATKQELNEAIIRKCYGSDDYNFVLEKINKYLSKSKNND